MTSAFVRGLQARAVIATPAPEIRRARRQASRGDRAWKQLLERYEHGDVVIARLTAIALVEGAGERPQTVPCCHETVWIDCQTGRAVAEERMRQIARRDFKTVADGLRDHRGIQLSDHASTIAVDIVIDSALAEQLALRAQARGSEFAGR